MGAAAWGMQTIQLALLRPRVSGRVPSIEISGMGAGAVLSLLLLGR